VSSPIRPRRTINPNINSEVMAVQTRGRRFSSGRRATCAESTSRVVLPLVPISFPSPSHSEATELSRTRHTICTTTDNGDWNACMGIRAQSTQTETSADKRRHSDVVGRHVVCWVSVHYK
jgi:hypothetical protein